MINLIVAVDQNLLIGNSLGMPWHISEDLKYFREVTRGKTVVMGRKTYESIGRPLPNRTNVVLTRQAIKLEGVDVINNLPGYLATVDTNQDIFIIGGAEIYKLAYPYVEKLYITHIEAKFNGDTYFPKEYLNGDFTLVSANKTISSEGIHLTFSVYERDKKL